MKRLILSTALAMGALAAIGCGEEASAPAAAGKPKATVKKATAALPSADAGTSAITTAPGFAYAYNPLGKRDPFRPYEVERTAEDMSSICDEPLCQWDLEQLSLVAVVSGDANPLAMVEDPQRTGHIVRRNTRIGKQGGKVTQILRDCMVVTEYWTGPDGKINPNPVKVCIKHDKRGPVPTDLMNPNTKWQ